METICPTDGGFHDFTIILKIVGKMTNNEIFFAEHQQASCCRVQFIGAAYAPGGANLFKILHLRKLLPNMSRSDGSIA